MPSDDEVVEVDRNGRAVTRPQRSRLPALPGQTVRGGAAQVRNAATNLQILDPAPTSRPHPPRPGGAQSGRAVGLGGAILSLGTTRGTRRIGFTTLPPEPEIHLRDPNDDGGRHAPRHRFSIARLLEAFTSGRPPLDIGWMIGGQDVGAGNLPGPGFDPSLIHANKSPRPSFTYDFDALPLSSRQPASASALQPTSRFTNSISNLLNPKRKAALIDLATDSEEAKLAGDSAHSLPALICAGCDKPLLLGGGGDDRVWGLRCGHLICGACLDRIGRPLPPKPKPLIAKLEEALSHEPTAVPMDRLRKWKGKARQVSPELSARPFQDSSSGTSAPTHVSTSASSRYASLRPRPNAGPGSASGSLTRRPDTISLEPTEEPASFSEMSEFQPEAESQQANHANSNRRKRKIKAKGRKPTKSRVLQEWDYACPVEGCHRLHTRVLVGTTLQEASWKPKGDSGEIAVYTS